MQDNQDNKEIKEQPLNEPEEAELRRGQMLYEMDQSNPGWQLVIKPMLEGMAYHSWVDPRDCKDKGEWDWRELNAFHASNVATEILSTIADAVSRSQYLEDIKNGKIERSKGFKII